MKLPLNLISMLLLSISGVACAAEAASGAPDSDLPQPFDPNSASSLLESSPFTRSLNLSDSLVLTGIAYIQGKPVATIVNKATKENYVVSDEPNAQGWKLAETTATLQLSHTQAKVMIGNEVVTVRYSVQAVTPESMKKSGFKPGAGAPPDGGGDKPRREGPRPSQEDRDRYMSMSDSAKEKFRQVMTESREKMMNASPEERMAFAKKMFEKVEKGDRKTKK